MQTKWIEITPPSGYTGSVRYAVWGDRVRFEVSLEGTFATGAIITVWTAPAALRPALKLGSGINMSVGVGLLYADASTGAVRIYNTLGSTRSNAQGYLEWHLN